MVQCSLTKRPRSSSQRAGPLLKHTTMRKLILPSNPPCIGVDIWLWLPPRCQKSILLGQIAISANYRPRPKDPDGLPEMCASLHAYHNFENAQFDGWGDVHHFDPRLSTPFDLVHDVLTSNRSGRRVRSTLSPRRECKVFDPLWWVDQA